MKYKILNTREKKRLLSQIEKQWGAKPEIKDAILKSTKDRLYLVSRDISSINLDKLHINNLGLYFGTQKGAELRLSIEGSQIIGPLANKNILKLDSQQVSHWFAGNEISINMEGSCFLILKYNDDFVGCGKLASGKILNYVPKARRVDLI